MKVLSNMIAEINSNAIDRCFEIAIYQYPLSHAFQYCRMELKCLQFPRVHVLLELCRCICIYMTALKFYLQTELLCKIGPAQKSLHACIIDVICKLVSFN